MIDCRSRNLNQYFQSGLRVGCDAEPSVPIATQCRDCRLFEKLDFDGGEKSDALFLCGHPRVACRQKS